MAFRENDDLEEAGPSKRQKQTGSKQKRPDSKQKSTDSKKKRPDSKQKHKVTTQPRLDTGDYSHHSDNEEEEIDYVAPGIKDGVTICILTPLI